MKILIIGATSLVAKHIAGKLAPRHEIVLAGRSDAANTIDLERGFDRLSIDHADAVVNCAATFYRDNQQGFVTNALTNAIGPIYAFLIAQKLGAQSFIQLSSIFAYPARDFVSQDNYGLSKRHGDDNILLLAEKANINAALIVPAQIYDDGGEARKHQPFLYAIAQSASAGRDIVLYGKRDVCRNYVHVDDVARAVGLAIERGASGRLLCTGPSNLPLSRIAQHAIDLSGGASAVRWDETKPDIAEYAIPEQFPSVFADTDEAQRIDIRTGLSRIMQKAAS